MKKKFYKIFLNQGAFETDFFSQRIPNKKLKCAQGSHPYNGSCYFISDKKYNENDLNDIIQNVLKVIEEKKRLPGFKSGPNSGEKFQLSSKARWPEAISSCKQLDPFSSLIQFNESNTEFEFIVNLLKNYTLAQDVSYYEQKYWIGLTYKSIFF